MEGYRQGVIKAIGEGNSNNHGKNNNCYNNSNNISSSIITIDLIK